MHEDREEHLIWCKKRAMEYFNRGDYANAVGSMLSDLSKHPETKCNDVLAVLGIMYVSKGDIEGVRRFIEGFR
jgi:hypothetical protein